MRVIVPSTITLIETNVEANAEAEYNPATTYALGATVQIATAHRVYESLVADNLGNAPADNPTKWLDLGATEQYKMVDEFVNTQTSMAEELHVTVGMDRLDHLLLLGVVGTEINLKLWDGASLLWEETTDLVYTDPLLSVIEDWQGYFFGQNARLYSDIFRQVTVLAFTPTLEITITYPGGTAKLAMVTAGLAVHLGATQYGAEIGILSYSKKVTDGYGRTYLKQGARAKRNQLLVWVDSARIDIVNQWLMELDAIPCAWVGDEKCGTMALLTFGFFRDYGIVLEKTNKTLLRIEIESLT